MVQVLKLLEILCEETRRVLADMDDTKGIEKPREGGILALFDRFDKVLGRLLRVPGKFEEVFFFQLVDIDKILYEALRIEKFHVLFAKPFNVHGSTRGIVKDALLDLGSAVQADAPVRHLSFFPLDKRAADRAVLRRREFLLMARSFLFDNSNYVRYHISCTLDNDCIPYADVLSLYLVPVMERGARDHHPSDLYRVEHGYRRFGPGPFDARDDALDHGCSLVCRELVVYCPAWFTRL